MDTILLFQHVDSYGARLRTEGITEFARQVGWNVQSYEETVNAEQLREINSFWNPIGAILSPNNGIEEFNASLFSPESTVLLDSFPPTGMERFSTVITDSSTVVELAARELLGTKCASYGFVSWPTRRMWSENRRITFTKLLALQGIKVHAFKPSRPDLSVQELQQEMARWIQAMPKPCGILTANDRIGTHFLSACMMAQIEVPFDCIVVGVDDNDKLCESVNPTLSSVGLDFKGSGYRAAEMLYQMLQGQLKDKPIESRPPLGFTRRNSSRVFLQTDRYVLKASEMIRAKACQGLEARDVLSVFPCSRRLAEIRFRKATGHSILNEIREVRIENAKRLLANPFQRLDAVAEQCGYESDTTFRRIFKEETGLTLREYQAELRRSRT